MAANGATQRPWADTPLALIPTPEFLTKKHDLFTSGASHMCMVHNSIFRGYNSIYHQAPHVVEADKADFIGYCLTWHKFLQAHADNEDSGTFPRTERILDDKTIWEESHMEHDAFVPTLAGFRDYLTKLKSPSDFSGTKLLEIMATFQEPFESHMRAEVTTIANFARHPRTPEAGSAEEKAIRAAFERAEGMALMGIGITDVMPFFIFNFDREYEDGLWKDWPPIPRPVRWGITSVARVLHPGWWRFASCDVSGKRRELYAVPGMEKGT